jgi:hypothetical protein
VLYDEYRCFLVDPGLAQDAFITGYEVTPGNAAIVHHIIGFAVDPTVTAGHVSARQATALRWLGCPWNGRPGKAS